MQTAPRTITAILPNREPSADSAPRYGMHRTAGCPVIRAIRNCPLPPGEVLYGNGRKMENAELVDVYADEAISGRGTKKREDFNRLIATVKKAGSTG